MLATLLISLFVTRTIVIPAQFGDLPFACTHEQMQQTLSAAGAYFDRQIPDKAPFTFDLGPTVTLPENYAYYGRNTTDKRDEYLYRAVLEACRQADTSVDFSQYDSDNDGAVDAVMILIPGPSEADGAGELYVWPRKASLSDDGAGLILDGKRVDVYAVTNEEGHLGTLCHEFGHILGLPDLYDTDGKASGGLSPALRGSTALMDEGNRNDGYRTPPSLNAVERDFLHIGRCEEISPGSYTLEAVSDQGRYLRISGPDPDEYFLLECRAARGDDAFIGGDGLLVYHIDRSSLHPRGQSDFFLRELNAAERWSFNQINCRPGQECARLVPADSLAPGVAGAFFGRGVTDLGMGSQVPLRFYDGSVPPLALTGIGIQPDGSVSMTVIEPLHETVISPYQDAVLVRWTVPIAADKLAGCELSWTDENGQEHSSQRIQPSSDGRYAYIIERLRPGTSYKLTLRVLDLNQGCYTNEQVFTTKPFNEKLRPFIYLNDVARYTDGIFPRGASLFLRVFNLPGASVSWYFNGERVSLEADGTFLLTRDGELKAVARLPDGSEEILVKKITVQ
ncbi:MAG: M6 family metalloprotease domain-containing protein [Bacteroidales bacterium]|nr:M6 family metalloprotease domain-containing protein [Bacteroidales bacterium]